MDVSDGIMRDLPRLLGLTGELSAAGQVSRGSLGAEIMLARGQLHPEVVGYAEANGKNPVHEALLGGEDYALLGSCAPDMLPPLHAAIPRLTSATTSRWTLWRKCAALTTLNAKGRKPDMRAWQNKGKPA